MKILTLNYPLPRDQTMTPRNLKLRKGIKADHEPNREAASLAK